MSQIDQEGGVFSFLKGGQDVVAVTDGNSFDRSAAVARVRENLNDALNARHLSFLLGSGCSSLVVAGHQRGIPTMGPLASEFLHFPPGKDDLRFTIAEDREKLSTILGVDLHAPAFATNLERLLEALFSFQNVLQHTTRPELAKAVPTVSSVVSKIRAFISEKCYNNFASEGAVEVVSLYQDFYRKLIYRDRTLPRPWVFTTNYDLFNETAMDRLGVQYCNGFSGSVERRLNPAVYRYALAEQLDLLSRKWAAVDNFVYLCKLHGSINWVEQGSSLFPIREVDPVNIKDSERVMIYPTPMKQSASLGSPYSDLFREFQSRIAREQSVLFVLGYSFGDDHVNNIIFQALTVPSFRLIAFISPDAKGVPERLRALNDPRIWMIGGGGPDPSPAHHFQSFVKEFMPAAPGAKVDSALEKILSELISPTSGGTSNDF